MIKIKFEKLDKWRGIFWYVFLKDNWNRISFLTLIIFIILVSGLSKYSICERIDNISIEFQREHIEKGRREIVKGKIYYQFPSKTVIKVIEPINQQMIVKEKEMIIYYPENQKAFRITSSLYPFSMPFFQAFIGVVKEDYGLTEMGYTLKNYERKGDTLISYWSPPKNLSKLLGEITLEYKENKLTRLEIRAPKGNLISQTLFKNHIIYGSIWFPLEISISRYLNSGPSFEKVVYSNPQFNAPLPPEIVNFKIPANVKVKEVEW